LAKKAGKKKTMETQEKKKNGIRCRKYFFSLENIKDPKALAKKMMPTRWAYIVHDKDVLDSGEMKPVHVHFFLEFPRPVALSTVAKAFGVAENFI